MKATFNIKTHPKPTTGAWPFALPASGERGFASTNTVLDAATYVGKSYADLNGIITLYGSAAVANLKDATGKVIDFLYWPYGGGHSIHPGSDGTYCFRGSTNKFEELQVSQTTVDRPVTDYDLIFAEILPAAGGTVGRPASAHGFSHVHALDSDEPNGPAFVLLLSSAYTIQGQAATGQMHLFNTITKQWVGWGSNQLPDITGSFCSIKDSKRHLFFTIDFRPNHHRCATISYATDASAAWNIIAYAPPVPPNIELDLYQVGAYDPIGDLYILAPNSAAPNFPSSTCSYFDPNNLAAGPQLLNTTGTPPSTAAPSFEYCVGRDQLVLWTQANPSDLSVLTPPTGNRRTGTWTWSQRAFTGPPSQFNKGDGVVFNRWKYVPVIDSVIACTNAAGPTEIWRL
jgi:hypothetical protein